MQFLTVSSSVGNDLSVPLTACVTAPVNHIDQSSCTVIVYDHNFAKSESTSGWSLDFKPALDPSCTLEAVNAGLCSVCTADSAMAGSCPAGKHTFITNVVAPGGLVSNTSLSLSIYVGAALFSSEVLLQFEVVADTRSLEDVTSASARLQTMLISTQVPSCLSMQPCEG